MMALVGMAVAKCSLGVFLLRFILKRWHRLTVWAVMVILLVLSFGTAAAFWVNSSPLSSTFDSKIPRISGFNLILLLKSYGSKST